MALKSLLTVALGLGLMGAALYGSFGGKPVAGGFAFAPLALLVAGGLVTLAALLPLLGRSAGTRQEGRRQDRPG